MTPADAEKLYDEWLDYPILHGQSLHQSFAAWFQSKGFLTPADAEKPKRKPVVGLHVVDSFRSRVADFIKDFETLHEVLVKEEDQHARLRAAAQAVLDSHLHEGVDGIVNATRKAMGALAAELEGGVDATSH